VDQLLVFNKIDLTGDAPRVERDGEGRPRGVFVSAVAGQGMDLLLEALHERLGGELIRGRLALLPAEGRVRARLYELAAVEGEQELEQGGWLLELALPRLKFTRLCHREGVDPQRLRPLPCAASDSFLQSEACAAGA